jgi:hypothetical protein
MSKYLGDFSATDVIDFKFTTFRPSTGAPFTLAGTPVVSVYKDNDTTQSTTGVVLTVDFDTVTGLNHVRVTTTDAFYANGSEFECVITAGTVDSVSVVGSCIGRFTLRSQASLYPTTASRTLDVNANGEAGIDWANVGNPTTTLALTNTTIANVTVGTIATNAITAASITDGVIASEVWDASLASYNAGSSFGQRILRSFNAQSECDVSASRHIAADVHALQNAVITAASVATGAIDADALATDAVEEIADAILKRNLDSSGNEVSTTSSGRTVRNALRILRNKVDASGGTQVNVYNEADTTIIWSQPITTSVTADPIVKVGT